MTDRSGDLRCHTDLLDDYRVSWCVILSLVETYDAKKLQRQSRVRMAIMLHKIFSIENLSDYKVHFAKWNKVKQPLDVFTTDRQEWQSWQGVPRWAGMTSIGL